MAGENNDIEILQRKALILRIKNAADGLLKGSKIATNGLVIVDAINNPQASFLDRAAAALIFIGSIADGLDSKLMGKGLPRSHAPAWECIRSMNHGQNAEIRINSLPFTKRGLVDAVVIIFPATQPPMKTAA